MPTLELEKDARILCPKCGEPNPAIQQVKKKRSFLSVLLELALLFIPVIGWISLAVYMMKREKTEPQCTCQKCAHSWLLNR